MKKYLRWQGAVGFLAVIALFAAFIYVFAGSLIKLSIEKGGSWYLGAEVNLAQASVDWSPVTLTLNKLEVTDANEPEFNLVEFNNAEIKLDVWQYLIGKTIINNLELTGLAFHTKRSSPGKVYLESEADKPSEEDSEDPTSDKELSLPSVEDILAKEELITPEKAKALKTTYQTEQEKLKQIKDTLPNKEALAEYKAKINEITSKKVKTPADLIELKEALDVVKDKIKQDKALVKQAKEQFAESKENIQTAIKELKDAPGQDWDKVKNKYQLDSFEADDIAHILFGEAGREYYGYAEKVYQQLKPLLDKDSQAEDEAPANPALGQFVHFTEQDPLPSWLVKAAQVEILTSQGKLLADIKELNNQHWLRDLPTQVHLASTQKDKAKVRADLTFYKTQDANILSQGDWDVSNLKVSSDKQASKKKFSVQQTNLASSGSYKIEPKQKYSHLTSQIKLNLTNSQFSSSTNSGWQQDVITQLNRKDAIPVKIQLSGKLTNPDWQIDSGISQIVKDTMKAKVDDKLDQYKAKLNTKLNEQVQQSLNLNQSDAAELTSVEALLEDTDQAINDLLKAKLKSVTDEKKDELKEKLKNKLKGLF